MFDKMVRHIVRTGKAHSWLKPFALFTLLVLFGGAALAEWIVTQSARAWQAAGRIWTAFIQRLTACRERMTARRGTSEARPFRPSHRPVARAAAVALSVCMVFTAMPQMAFAAEVQTGLCEHHPVHTPECGYQEAEPGHPCEHEHTACYTDELICGLEETTTETASGSDAGHTHSQDCYKLDCPHERGEHDESCGYAETVEGTPCGFVCTECGQPVHGENPGNGIETVTVAAFEALDGAVAEQTVPFGTAREALNLPYSLRAAVYTTAPDTEAVLIDGVTWEPDEPYEGAAGSYAFTASATGYACADGVEWPVIIVTVEETAPDEVDALCAAIDALPTVEELYKNAPGNADPEFDDWVTETKARLAEVSALWEQFLTLSEDGAAMERITEARADKLEALHNLAERLAEMEPKASEATPSVNGTSIYANGVPLLLAAGSGDTTKTVVYIDKGTIGQLDEGTDEIFDPDGSEATYDGTAAGNNLSSWYIYGGSLNQNVTSTQITMTGGKISSIYGGGDGLDSGESANVTGNTSVKISGGIVSSIIYAGGRAYGNASANVNGNAKLEITGGEIGDWVHGGGIAMNGNSSATVGGSSTVAISGTAVIKSRVFGGGYANYFNGHSNNSNVTGAATVTISGNAEVRGSVCPSGHLSDMSGNYAVNSDDSGNSATVGTGSSITISGGAKIGGSTKGIFINGGSPTEVKTGVESFVIDGDLTESASVNVQLPAGYDITSNPTIATGAVEADLAKIKLVGDGAEGREAYFDSNSAEIKVRGKSAAHTHCVCGGSVTTGGHTGHSDVTWTAWTSTTSLPDAAGSYYLTENVALTAAWTVPAGTVDLCLNGKTVTGSGVKSVDGSKYAYVDIPSGAALAVCDCGSGGGMTFTSSNLYGSSVGIYGGEGSSFTLYGGGVSNSKSVKYTVYALYNNGGTFAVHGGTVSATQGSSGTGKDPFAYGVYTEAGTTTLWGGSFEAKVTNTTSYSDGSSGAYGAWVNGTGELRLAGAPAFTASNSTTSNNQAAIYASNDRLYACAASTLFSGGNVNIKVSSSIARDGGIVVREVDSSNKEKFSVTNKSAFGTLTEITEGGKTHLALTGPYSVQFNANGGAGTTMTDQHFSGYTVSQALTQNAYTKDGSSFAGWNTKQDGTGTAYANQATVSKLAYGGTVTLYAQWKAAAHTHAMSVDCSTTEGTQVIFDKALTSQNGQPCINGTAVSKTGNYYKLPTGSYYLAADVELDGYIHMQGSPAPTVNLCLNGHKLAYTGSTNKTNVIKITAGELNLCDCDGSGGSHTITSQVTNGSVTITGGLVTGATDSGIYLFNNEAGLHLYGGTVAGNGGEAAYGGGVSNGIQGTFAMHGGSILYNRGDYGGGVYSAGSLTIAGGEISNNRAKSAGGGIFASYQSGSSLTFSGQPVISQNVAGEAQATAADNNLGLASGFSVTVGENFAPTTPIGVTTQTAPTQNSPVSITGTNSKDYSSYFTSDNDDYVIRNIANNVVQLRIKSTDATLSALSYTVGSGSATAVPNFASGTENYNVELPFGTSATAAITLTGEPNDSEATITENNGVTLSGGSGTATIKVTAEDGSTTKTYTVNFTTAADTRSDAKQITAFTISGQVGDTAIDQSAHTVAVIMPYGTDVTNLTPTITVSNKASVNPASGTAQDFTSSVTYTVTAENETTQEYTVTVTVQAPSGTAPTITTQTLPDGTVGTAYSQTLAATGTTPITWSVTEGSLPGGLELNTSTGVISGTPTTAGTSTFTVTARNATGSATKELSIKIDAPEATVTGVTVTPATVSVQKGNTQQFSATVTGTNDPAQTVTWAVEGGVSGTGISNTGLLTVDANETATTLTVKATSTVDSTKSGTATVTVTDQPVTRYTLTVTGGTGSGDYAEGAQITVTANAETGRRFKEWTASGITLNDKTANPVTIIMPANAVTLTATYDNLYAVTTSSEGGGTATASPNTAAAGETVTLTAAPNSGYQFKEWQVVSGGVSLANANAASTSFTMPGAAVEVKAIFELQTTPPPTHYTLTVTGSYASATGEGSYSAGETVTIYAGSRSGYSFSGWTVASGNVSLANQYQSTTTFTMPAENVAVQANWSRNSSGGGGDDDSSGSGSGSSTPPTIVTPPETKPDAPVTAQTEIKAQSDGKGGSEVTVPKSAVDSAIQKAQEEAKRNGTQAGGIAVQVNVAADSQNVNSLTVNLPKATQEQIIDNKVQSFALALERPDITLSLSLASVQEINRQANADVQLTATRLTDTSNLSGEAKAVVGSRPVFQLTATYQNGANTITDFGGSSVTVAIPYKLQPGESAGGLYLVYIDGQGKPQFLMNSSYDAENEVLRGATTHFSLYAVGYKAPDAFSDIANHWAKEDIEFVAARSLMAGVGNGRFNPDGTMTRAMFVTALGRLAGVNPADYKSGTFTDVKADAYYAPYVEWAEKTGVVVGIGGGLFAPDQIVSRQEMAVIMANYAKAMGCKVPVSREAMTFTDNASIASWAADAVKAMQQAGVLMGKDGNRFDPSGSATRAEAAAVLHRYVELVIDRQTAQGLDVNDSGSAMLWENGKLVKSASRTVNSRTYAFNGYGEAALPVSDKKYRTHIVKKNEYFWSISRLYGCTMQEIMDLNGLKMGDVIHPGDVLKVPQA